MLVRVLTFNVWNDEGDPRRIGLINREVRSLRPDLVAFQEVRRPRLDDLVAGTGLHTTHQDEVLADPPPEAQRYGGTVVATRRPHRVVDVRAGRIDGAHWWTLTVEVDGLRFVVPTTPWEPGATAARDHQAALVAELDGPVIVAGDLNADPSDTSVVLLAGRFRDAWAAAGAGPGHTFAGRRIDYVLVSPEAGRVVAARRVADRPVDGIRLSDHAGLLVDVAAG
jgi:endonuclease/exonuclease/phosphatase family metal-dependent hydrolase